VGFILCCAYINKLAYTEAGLALLNSVQPCHLSYTEMFDKLQGCFSSGWFAEAGLLKKCLCLGIA
jgi:hypothetical protein